jgi:hypothetical protein
MTDVHTDIDPEEVADLEVGEVVVEKPERDWESEAAKDGWKPKDEWHGARPWKNAQEFVEHGEDILVYVKRDRDRLRDKVEKSEADMDARFKRLEGTYIKTLERQKTQYDTDIKAIESQERKAVEEGDVASFDELKTRREAMGAAPEVPKDETPSVDPAVTEWAKNNAWFTTDPEMRAMAVATAGRVSQNGADVHTQIEAAEKEVRLRYPEKFEAPKQAIETDGQNTRKTRAPKGVAQLPKEAREAFDSFVRMGAYKKDEIAKYAETYWGQD